MTPMRLRAVIVEDSAENIETLRHLLDRLGSVEVIGEARDLKSARELLAQPDFDVAFLDIQLKEGTVFEVLDDLVKEGPLGFEAVFVTAHGSFENATQAIRFAALDFVTKPVDEAALSTVVEKAMAKREAQSGDGRLGFLLELLRTEQAPDAIGVVLPKGVIEFVKLDDVAWFKADESVCDIGMADGSKYRSTKPFGHYLDLLSGHNAFVQIAKGSLVNTRRLKRYDHRERMLTLDSGETLMASVRYARTLRKQLAGLGAGGGGNLLDRLKGLLGG